MKHMEVTRRYSYIRYLHRTPYVWYQLQDFLVEFQAVDQSPVNVGSTLPLQEKQPILQNSQVAAAKYDNEARNRAYR